MTTIQDDPREDFEKYDCTWSQSKRNVVFKLVIYSCGSCIIVMMFHNLVCDFENFEMDIT